MFLSASLPDIGNLHVFSFVVTTFFFDACRLWPPDPLLIEIQVAVVHVACIKTAGISPKRWDVPRWKTFTELV